MRNRFEASDLELAQEVPDTAPGLSGFVLGHSLDEQGEHAEFDTSRLRFGASPQFQQQQAQQQQMQQAQMQAQQQAAQQKMGMDQQKMQMDAAGKQQELQFKGVAHQQDMQHKQEAHTMEMQKSAAEMAMAQAQAEQDALREIVRMKIQQIRPQGRGKA